MKTADKSLKQLISRSLSIGVSLGVFLVLSGPAFSQEGVGPNNAELEKLETKMFSRLYPNDPPEKRVERLELLVFGATQAGGLDERWSRITKAVKDRQNPESTVAQPKGAEAPATASASAAPLKGNYPAVDSLEWRVLKKTFRGEPISERLSRLETKLLGQANPGMALVDRVERLKKIGASVAAGSQPANPGTAVVPPGILGPMPKAYPRGNPFSFADPTEPLAPGPFSMQPFSMQPFSGGSDDLSSINRMMSEMFSQMNRQMRDLKNMPPGVYQYKIEPGAPGSMGITPFKIQPGKPGQASPFQPFPQAMPKKAPSIQDSLPPYADPNSI